MKYFTTGLIYVFLLEGILLASQGTIRLKESVIVTEPTVTLGQVAEIQVTDRQMHGRLLALKLVHADGVYMSIPLIEQSLQEAGIAPACLDIFGASRCQITRELKPSDPDSEDFQTNSIQPSEKNSEPEVTINVEVESEPVETLVDALNREVARLSRFDADRLHIQWQCRPTPELLKRELLQDRFALTPRSTMVLGKVYFDVVDTTEPVFQDNEGKSHTRSYSVRGKAQYLCESLIAARQLYPGEVIVAEDVKLFSRRIDSMRDAGMTDFHQVVGLEVARLIPEGTLINPRLLKKLILIERNDDVNVTYNDGRIAVRFRGTAKQAGGLGDTILVQDVSNKKVIQGRITGSGQVLVGDEKQSSTILPSATLIGLEKKSNAKS